MKHHVQLKQSEHPEGQRSHKFVVIFSKYPKEQFETQKLMREFKKKPDEHEEQKVRLRQTEHSKVQESHCHVVIF